MQISVGVLFVFPDCKKIALANKFMWSPLMKFDSNTFNGSIKTHKSEDLRYCNRHFTGTKTSQYGNEREGHLLAVMTSKTDDMIYVLCCILFSSRSSVLLFL